MSGLEPLFDLGNVVAVYLQPESESVAPCVVMEVVGGPKRYARFWAKEMRLEWGWSLHPSSELVWGEPTEEESK